VRGSAPLYDMTPTPAALTAENDRPLVAAATTDEHALAERALTIARRTALGVLGDAEAAADVAQDVAVLALRKAGTLRDPAAADAWLHRVAVRAALRHARREGKRRAAERASHEPSLPGRPDPDPASAVQALFAGLPHRQRAALTLRYVHDLSDEQIARALGCRRGAVRSMLSRGRDAIRPALERTDP